MSHKLTKLELLAQLKERNPIEAARFYARNFYDIRKEQQAAESIAATQGET